MADALAHDLGHHWNILEENSDHADQQDVLPQPAKPGKDVDAPNTKGDDQCMMSIESNRHDELPEFATKCKTRIRQYLDRF